MKSQISFTTDLFATERPPEASDRQLGEDLAVWLAEAASGGEFVFDKPYQAEWGWVVEAHSGGEDFIVGCGIMNESFGDAQADWLITVEKVRRWKFFGAKDSRLRGELCDLIQNVLRDKPHIREIRWTDRMSAILHPKNSRDIFVQIRPILRFNQNQGFLSCQDTPSGTQSSIKKALLDAKRGKIFTKMIKEITVATRTGGSGDIDSNARLRKAVTDAKGAEHAQRHHRPRHQTRHGRARGRELRRDHLRGLWPERRGRAGRGDDRQPQPDRRRDPPHFFKERRQHGRVGLGRLDVRQEGLHRRRQGRKVRG